MGVEFQEIRQVDSPLLIQLKKPRKEDFANLEFIAQPGAASAAAG